ncbi:Conjugative transfer protein TrbB [Rickettsiales bacterium Ac37b]|nr:Conjugative transfer protein TrbB [Rickettsiales bacterium Ac37b]
MNNIFFQEELIARLQDKLKRELGPEIMDALYSNDIIEIMLNPDGKVWYDYLEQGMIDSGIVISKHQAENLLGTIAAMKGTVINYNSPILETTLPFDGSRFTGIISPISVSPSFTIRKRPKIVFTLTNYIENGIITSSQAQSIKEAIKQKENILVVGGTGSGKTTLVNTLLYEMSIITPQDRIIIIEDTVELKCSSLNSLELRTIEDIDITKVLRTTLRLRPCRIIIGEIRGSEANSLIKAWNTGHPGGISTIHANSAYSGLIRLEQLIKEAGIKPIPEIIAETIKMVIFIERINMFPWRKVREIVKVKAYKHNQYRLEII